MIAFVFAAIVKVVRAAMLALELCFTFDLFGRDHGHQIPHALQSAQHFFTEPWMPVAFAVAAIWGAWRGIAQHRVAQTVSGYALMVAMMIGGLVIVSDPSGTLGWVDRSANQASLGALAAFAGHNPTRSTAGFSDALSGVFQQTVERPWCTLEFGDVDWCMSPPDAEMRRAAADVAAHTTGGGRCTRRPVRRRAGSVGDAGLLEAGSGYGLGGVRADRTRPSPARAGAHKRRAVPRLHA
jgi:hypothetical protein